jgi:hypothetical protein
MKNNIWYKLFNKKDFSYNSNSKKIQSLKKNYSYKSFLLGSVIYPDLSYKKFLNIIKFQNSKLKIQKKSSLMDFGSGNGAFLFFFIKKYNLKKNFSLELSKPLILFQKKIIKKTTFIQTHHYKITNLKKFTNGLVDNSICNSVFQYFTSEKYAKYVLEFLIKVTKKSILIYDIKNFETKNNYTEKVRKRQKLNRFDFIKKYKNTPIRFYKKKFFINVLDGLKLRYNFTYKFLKLPKDATDNKFGYCLLIKKKNGKIFVFKKINHRQSKR